MVGFKHKLFFLFGIILILVSIGSASQIKLINGGLDNNRIMNLEPFTELSNSTFGEMSNHSDSNPYLFTLPVQDQWFHMENFIPGDLSKVGFDNNSLVIQEDGMYDISFYNSFGNAGGGTNDEYQSSFFLNGVEMTQCEYHRKLGTAGDVDSASGGCLEFLNVGDLVQIDMRNRDSTTTAKIFAQTVVIVKLETLGGSGSGGVSTFLALSDTPSAYTGDGNNCVKVNVGETGLVFGSCSASADTNTQMNTTGKFLTNNTLTHFFDQAYAEANTDWLSTFNISYDVGSFNQTYDNDLGNTFNSTYDSNSNTNTQMNTDEKFLYNNTLTHFFNISYAQNNTDWLSTFNISYDVGSFNQTYDNDLGNTFNSTYALREWGNLTDVSFNETMEKGIIPWWNGTAWTGIHLPVSLGSERLILLSSGVVKWQPIPAIPVSDLNSILTSGNSTGGEDMLIGSGDSIYFDSSGTKLTSDTSGDLDLYGNLQINNGAYEVANNQFAFRGASFTSTGLKFDATSPPRFSFISTTGIENWYIEALSGNSDMFLQGAFATGSNTFGGLSDGDGNITDLWYNNLNPKSPHSITFDNPTGHIVWLLDIENFSEGKKEGIVELDLNWDIVQSTILTREMSKKINKIITDKKLDKAYDEAREICEITEFYSYVSEKEYRNGSRDCLLDQTYADYNCQVQFEDRNYKWDDGRKICYEDTGMKCEDLPWQFWRGNQCNTNWMLECAYNGKERNESWDGTNCVYNKIIECENQGYGWDWNDETKSCEYDEGQSKREQYNECLKKGREWFWNGNTCEKY